jgi:8-hydroxy-5-deazaflavin:NADPH oxidoreductase
MTTTIGIIGSGHIGGTLAALFARAGHQVIVSNSRGPETLGELVDSIGPQARAATAAEAAEQGDVIVVSVPLGRISELPTAGVTGKIVIDTNNYYPQRDGQIAVLDDDTTTSCELLAVHLAGTRVVKEFNQIFWEHLRDNGRPAGDPDRLAIPIVGDDLSAKQSVTALIDEIGFDTVDVGELSRGRLFQPDGLLYIGGTTEAAIREAITG